MNQRATDKASTVTSQPQGEGKTESDQTANKEGGARKEKQPDAATPTAETNTARHAATGGRTNGRTDASETRLKRRPEELKPQGGQRPTGSPTRGSEATGPEGGRAGRDHCGLRSFGTRLSREEKGCEATLGHDRDVPRGASEHCGATWFVRGCVLPQERQNLRAKPPASLRTAPNSKSLQKFVKRFSYFCSIFFKNPIFQQFSPNSILHRF